MRTGPVPTIDDSSLSVDESVEILRSKQAALVAMVRAEAAEQQYTRGELDQFETRLEEIIAVRPRLGISERQAVSWVPPNMPTATNRTKEFSLRTPSRR